jgi:hypothetical protein
MVAESTMPRLTSKPITDDWALEKPIEAPELGASFGGSDTSYYILAGEGPADDELGALEVILVVDFGTGQVLVTHGIDKQ